MPGIKVDKLEDGRTLLQPSQSWLNTFLNCPELARQEMIGVTPRKETDATAIGTAVHTAFEEVLLGGSVGDAESTAIAKFEELTELENFEWVQIKTKDTAIDTVRRVYWTWANEVLPQLPPVVAVEKSFDVVLHEDERYVIRLKGTMDALFEGRDGPEVKDWKTAGRKWDESEVRWKVQPTIYTYAIGCEYGLDDEYEFDFVVMVKSRQEFQIITTKRDKRHWSFLKDQLLVIGNLIDADLPVWPLRDQHHLCSGKWCPVYDNCRGAHGL